MFKKTSLFPRDGFPYMPLQAILGLSLHLVRSQGKQFDAKTMQKHI